MPFDAKLVLRDGLVDLDESEAAAVAVTANADGAYAIDLKETGVKGLACVMVVPDYHATLDTEPITYDDTLTVVVQASDYLDREWEAIANFPVLTALMRKLTILAVTAFAAADIGKLATGGTTTDTGAILHIGQELYTIGKVGELLVAMAGADDLFDDVDEAIDAAAGTGDGTMTKASEVVSTRGVYVVRFATDKRYLRTLNTVTAGGHFYGTQIMLSPYPFKTL